MLGLGKLFQRAGDVLSHVIHGDDHSKALAKWERARKYAIQHGEDPDKSRACLRAEADLHEFERGQGQHHRHS